MKLSKITPILEIGNVIMLRILGQVKLYLSGLIQTWFTSFSLIQFSKKNTRKMYRYKLDIN